MRDQLLTTRRMNRSTKRQRVEDEEQTDVRLREELRGLLGGRKYVKAQDLTRFILLAFAKKKGAVKEVNLISVTMQ